MIAPATLTPLYIKGRNTVAIPEEHATRQTTNIYKQNRMKKNLFLLAMLVLVSCTDQLTVEETAGERAGHAPASELSALIEQARWGDGQAYLRLADCYRDGKGGVNKDFMGMIAMVSLSEDYEGGSRIEDYLSSMPEESEYRLVVDALTNFDPGKQEDAPALAERLIAQGSPEGYALKGIIFHEQGDRAEGRSLLELAAGKGSSLAELYLCIPDLRSSSRPDIDRLKAVADRMPIAYNCLGRIHTDREDGSMKDEPLAVYYYLKADEKACLGRDGARWLLHYHDDGGDLGLSETDIERLRILAGWRTAGQPEPVYHYDMRLQAAIAEILQKDTDEYMMWTKAAVYVVETSTGKIRADVAFERNGKEFVPYTDTYDGEQSVMECGSAFLALLSSGKVSPGCEYDTGYGVYGDVRDHNWRRGGYGRISLERALELRSQVAFTMAGEQAYGDNTEEFDALTHSYLAGEPNSAMGILTFYNAVANGGKMVRLVSEGEGGIVLQEQMADPRYVKELQTGLQNCVSQGLFRKARRDYVNVSACGRTFITDGEHRRMEMFGYFPSEAPLYTIMMVLEKDGLPASANGMCGPVFAKTADLLVDTYRLQPMLTRLYEDADEVIEITATVAFDNNHKTIYEP